MIGPSPEQKSLERPLTAEGQLLVEGRVPEMFFREMIDAYGLVSRVEVRTFGDISKSNLQPILNCLAKSLHSKNGLNASASFATQKVQLQQRHSRVFNLHCATHKTPSRVPWPSWRVVRCRLVYLYFQTVRMPACWNLFVC